MRQLAPLPNTYNLENTTDLITKFKNTPIHPQFTLASLDITNLYTNIPVTETREIIAKVLAKNVPNPPKPVTNLSVSTTPSQNKTTSPTTRKS